MTSVQHEQQLENFTTRLLRRAKSQLQMISSLSLLQSQDIYMNSRVRPLRLILFLATAPQNKPSQYCLQAPEPVDLI